MTVLTPRRALLTVSLALLPALALAHPGSSGHDTTTFALGLTHPFTGIDHLLAMLAIGLWAAQLGGRMRWAVPASFVLLLLLGAALVPRTGVPAGGLNAVEQGIAASVFVCGLLLAFAVRLPLAACMAIAGGFALLHGYAHAAEAPGQAGLAGYFAGFTLSTAALHALGFCTAFWLARRRAAWAVRWAGAVVVVCGAALLAV
ncbi:MAG: HupE/UreJ family protein [Pseudomonadota bacterium]